MLVNFAKARAHFSFSCFFAHLGAVMTPFNPPPERPPGKLDPYAGASLPVLPDGRRLVGNLGKHRGELYEKAAVLVDPPTERKVMEGARPERGPAPNLRRQNV